MGKKLEGNGLWESSRIILPEFRTAINERRAAQEKPRKPNLTEEEKENLFGMIRAALADATEISVILHKDGCILTYTGHIERIDYQLHRVKIYIGNDEVRWIDFADVIEVWYC